MPQSGEDTLVDSAGVLQNQPVAHRASPGQGKFVKHFGMQMQIEVLKPAHGFAVPVTKNRADADYRYNHHARAGPTFCHPASRNPVFSFLPLNGQVFNRPYAIHPHRVGPQRDENQVPGDDPGRRYQRPPRPVRLFVRHAVPNYPDQPSFVHDGFPRVSAGRLYVIGHGPPGPVRVLPGASHGAG